MTQLRTLACAVVATVGLFALVLTRAPVEVEHAVGGKAYSRLQLKEIQRLQGLVEHLTARLSSVEKDALDAKAAAPPMRGGDARSTRAATQPTLEPAGSFASPVEPVREGDGLERCTVADVPILRLLHKPCPDGMHGFDCKARWDLLDSFLPDPDRWLREWRDARHAVLDCPRAFFATFAQRLDDAHFEAEWDAQPFRIVPAPPRTIGKMLHQLVTANYYHLTRAGEKPTRRAPLPGQNYLRAGTPGFRWNVLDTGAQDNVIWRALRNGRRCADERVAWHCLWERFPTRRRWDAAVSDGSALGIAADQLYNASLAGEHPRGMVQYLAAAGVAAVFTRPAPALDRYLRDHLRVICHKPGPYCGRAGGEGSGPVAAVHVRHGDSCDRHRDQPGPFNAMFAPDPKKPGALYRVGFRYCYSWRVYRSALLELQKSYGVTTVVLATDDADGSVIRGLRDEKDFNWVYLDFPREQFVKKGWMEFRADLDEHAPFSLAAEMELLSRAEMIVGNMGSQVTRLIYERMIATTPTSVLPPFISVDGYGMCCDFTEDCSAADIEKRKRPIRECIYKYGTVTGGDQYFWGRDL